jgi:prevent-host-death family protein
MTKKKNKIYKQLEPTTISVAEGKKRFSSLLRDALEDKKEFIVTKRGKPVAVIIPYEEYKHSKRLEGYRKIMEAREAFLKSDVSADEVFEESKKQLEKKI